MIPSRHVSGSLPVRALSSNVLSSILESFVTYQATYTLAGPPELRWGNLKGMSAWE
jgi:hypothetical protein